MTRRLLSYLNDADTTEALAYGFGVPPEPALTSVRCLWWRLRRQGVLLPAELGSSWLLTPLYPEPPDRPATAQSRATQPHDRKENIMPLNLHNDFTPHIRWMAQTSTWRMSGSDGHEPVTWEHAIFDLANIHTGWGIFAEGQAPEWTMDPSLEKQAPKPQDGRDWRRGFKLPVFSDSAFGGVREFATTAVGAVRGILELYGQYEAESGQHFNQVPVVQYAGATPARIGKGNTSIPSFKIVQWVGRPDALPFNDSLPEKPAYQDHQAPLAQPRPQQADYVKPAVLVSNLDPNDSINL